MEERGATHEVKDIAIWATAVNTFTRESEYMKALERGKISPEAKDQEDVIKGAVTKETTV